MGDENKDLFKKLPDGFRQKFTQEILSRTSPVDVFRLSLVSKSFLAAANSDVVWDSFIPPDHRKHYLDRRRSYTYDSSKQLFWHLCTSERFWLDKWSGKMCLYVDHKSLAVTRLDTDYWKESVAGPVLGHVTWLEVCAKIPTSRLSPDTTYEAYLLFFLSKYVNYGFHVPIKTSIGIPGEESTKGIIYLDPRIANSESNHHYPNIKPSKRFTSALEVKLGEYFNNKGENRDAEVTLKEVKSGRPKCGARIVRIEMRAKCYTNL